MPVLEWLNKDKAVKASKEVKFRLLEEVPEFSCGENTNSIMVQGDNLDAFAQYDDNVEHSMFA